MDAAVSHRDLERLQIGTVTTEPFPGSRVIAAAMPGTVDFATDQRAHVEWQYATAAAVPISENTFFSSAQKDGSAVNLYGLKRAGRQVRLRERHLPVRRPTTKTHRLQWNKACR